MATSKQAAKARHEPLGLWWAGIALARRLNMSVKFGLLAVIVLIPMTIVAVVLLDRQADSLRLARSELQGMAVVPPVVDIIVLVQKHRGQSAMVAGGNQGALAERAKTRAALGPALDRAAEAVRAARAFDLAAAWQVLAARVQGLASDAPGGNGAVDSFQRHSELVRDLRHFVQRVGESSGLLYDPEPAAYLLMDMVVTRNLAWVEELAQVRGAGAGVLARTAADPTGDALMRQRLAALAGTLKDQESALAMLQRNEVPELGGDGARSASARFADTALQWFSGAAPARDAVAYFTLGTGAIDAVLGLQGRMSERLVATLDQRATALQRERQSMLAGMVLGLLVLGYALVSFYRAFAIDLGRLNFSMHQLAAGNLQVVATVRSSDEIGKLAVVLRSMIKNVSTMVAAVGSDAALVAHAGEQLSIGNRDLAERTEQQAANLQQTTASVHELASTVQQNAQLAGEVDRQAIKVRDIAEAGASQMTEAIASVEAIQSSAHRMDEIIGVIDTLAFQTNILALNAAVEAARAGEQGRGFAVVASEVRSLAQRSAASAGEIRALIKGSSSQVAASVAQIRAAGQGMARIVEGIRVVSGSVSQISTASAAQSTGLSEISASVGQLDEITQRNAHMVESAVQMSSGLEMQARSLTDAIGNFKLLQGVAPEAQALVARAQEFRAQCGSRDAFLRALTNPAQGFHDRDMYVFALDAHGTYLAFGGNPAKVGTRVQDVPGIDGEGLVRAIVTQASEGPGWVSYDITNPASGRVQAKMSFVCELDGVYLGCGIYKSLVG